MKIILLLLASSIAANATFCSAVGSFAQPLGTAPQQIVVSTTDSRATCGGAFQPVAIIFFGSDQIADGAAANYRRTIGFSAGASSNRAIWTGAADAATPATAIASREGSAVSYVRDTENGTTPVGKAYCAVSAVSSTGFTFRCSTIADSVAAVVNYLAFGGSDLTGAATGQITVPSTNTTTTTSALGFTPSVVIFTGQTSGVTSGAVSHIGACTAAACIGSMSQAFFSGSATVAHSLQRNNLLLGVQENTTGKLQASATVAAMDSGAGGEFVLNWTSSSGCTNCLQYLAIGGGAWTVGSLAQPSATGAQTVTLAGLRPLGVIAASNNGVTTAGTTPTTTAESTIGATDGTNQGTHWRGYSHNVTPSLAKQDLDRTAFIKLETEAGGGSTVNAAASITSLSPQVMSLHWSVADATAREVVFLVGGQVYVPPASLPRRRLVQ